MRTLLKPIDIKLLKHTLTQWLIPIAGQQSHTEIPEKIDNTNNALTLVHINHDLALRTCNQSEVLLKKAV